MDLPILTRQMAGFLFGAMCYIRMMEKLKLFFNSPPVRFLRDLYNSTEDHYIGLIAAGVAFYFFMGAFPAIAAVISLYGLFSDPKFITDQLDSFSRFLPPDSFEILVGQARAIAGSSGAALSLGLVFGIVLTIYSATKGVNALIKGFNIAYHKKETRNIVTLNSTSFFLTFVLMVYFLLSLSLVALMPAFFQIIHLPDVVMNSALSLRWPLLFLMAVVGLEILYYFGPCQKRPKWKWLSWGSFVGTILWLACSSFFSLFVSNFGNYNETYGSLGAVAVLLLWFWLSGLMILFGAEINATLDRFRSEKPPS